MQMCWNCHTQQLDGAIFCSECGASLITQGQRRETTTSLGQKAGASPPPSAPSVVPAPASPDITQGFRLVILNSGHRLELQSEQDMVVGRRDESRGILPDIDLTDYGGYDAGVSRRHAIISVRKGHCTLEDLGSANGTSINNRRVLPNQPVVLSDGDELKFGTLLLRVEMDL